MLLSALSRVDALLENDGKDEKVPLDWYGWCCGLAGRYDTSWMADRACRETPYPQPWSAGTKEWRIPVGWGDYNGNIKGRITPNPTTQLFTIDSSGTATIRKYNHEIRRAINNDVWLDDVLQDN